MTFTLRKNTGKPLTFAQLDGNFEEVERMVDGANQAIDDATDKANQASASAASAEFQAVQAGIAAANATESASQAAAAAEEITTPGDAEKGAGAIPFDYSLDYPDNSAGSALASVSALAYQDGVPLTVYSATQTIMRADTLYRVKIPASFPVDLAGSWIADQSLLALVGGADVLRADLANSTAAAKGAALVGFRPSIPGAVGRNVTERLNDRKSFFDFLTDPTRAIAYTLRLDTLDYTAEIQAAADYSAANKCAIDFPPGRALHTGVVFRTGSFFVGGGPDKVELHNTSTTSKSIAVTYANDSDWQIHWGLVGMTISATAIGAETQHGISIDTGRHGFLSRVKIIGHHVNLWQRATWSCYFENLDIESGTYGFLVDDGPNTPGVPNTYVALNLRYNGHNLDVRSKGLGAGIFSGGCNESAMIAGVRISGQENRTITFIGVNFENNPIDYISGDGAVANSGPEAVNFEGCQFNSRQTLKPFSMQLNRGQNLRIVGCHFVGYEEIADLSGNFGDFELGANSGATIFAKSTQANTAIQFTGIVYGRKARWCRIANTGLEYYQDANSFKTLIARRTTEQYERFSVGGDGLLVWHAFNAASPDTEFGRKAANCAGVGDDDALRSGRGASDSRPSAVTVGAGAMFYDTTISKPIWSNGSVWKDSSGTTV